MLSILKLLKITRSTYFIRMCIRKDASYRFTLEKKPSGQSPSFWQEGAQAPSVLVVFFEVAIRDRRHTQAPSFSVGTYYVAIIY